MAARFLIAIVLTSIIAAGCAPIRTSTRPVLDDRYTVVRLETWLDKSKKPVPMGFNQPVEISDADMARILESIRVVQPPGVLSKMLLHTPTEAEPAFTSAEAGEFAKPLAQALRTATPDERVVFFLHHQRSIYKGTTTSGITFVKDHRLNIILGRYYMGNQPGYPDIPVGGNPFPASNDQDFYFDPGPFETIETGKTAPGGGEPVYPKRWLGIDYASLLNPPPEASAPAPSKEPAVTGTPPPLDEHAMSLEEKLKTLNRLKEEGLISEEEYNAKKSELLKSF